MKIEAGASLSTNGQALTVNGLLTNNGLLETLAYTTSSISGALTNNGTLHIQSNYGGPCCSSPARLTVSGTLTNSSGGIIELTGGSTSELDVSGTLANSGAVNGEAGASVLRANALNGNITAVSGALYLGPESGTSLTSSATITNSGATVTVQVPAGGSFANAGTLATTTNGYIITVANGSGASFTNSGTLTTSSGQRVIVSGGTFTLGSGTVSGTVELDGAALAPGTVPSGATINLTAGSTVPGPDAVINNGTITLTASSVAGPLTNNGLLETSQDTTSSIGGALTNNGTLRVESFYGGPCGGCSPPAALTVSGTLTNTSAGTIELTGGGGRSELDVSGTLANSGAVNGTAGAAVLRANALNGTIIAVSGALYLGPESGTSLTSSATITNSGATVTVQVPAGGSFTNTGTLATTTNGYIITVANGSGASFTNNGTLMAGSGQRVIVSGGTFVLDSGTVSGTVELDGAALAPGTVPSGATLNLTAGSTVPGPGLLVNNGVLTLAGSSVNGQITNNSLLQFTNNGLSQTVQDTTSVISGAVTNNGTLRVVAGSCCGHISFNSMLTVSGTLTNASGGTVELTDQGCCNNNGIAGTAELDVSGTLANSGTINALTGDDRGARVLRANALSGTITSLNSGGEDLGLSIGPYSGTALTSSATITAQSAPVAINLPSGGSFVNTGTLAANNGSPITVNGGTFVPSGGATIGDVELDGAALAPGTIASGSSLKLTASSTVPGPDPVINSGTLTLAGSSITGPLTNNGTLLIPSGTTNTLGGSLTNSGTLRIQAGDCAVGATATIPGTLTNTSGGTIELTETGSHCSGSPGAASLFVTGTLINDGRISALHGDNGGGRMLFGPISNQSGGTITTTRVDLTLDNATLTNNGILSVDSGQALYIADAVTLEGSGTYQANVVNNGQLTVGAPVGSVNVAGNYQQGSGATLNLALAGTLSSAFSRLIVSGSATLAGMLNATFAYDYVPAIGDSFQILSAGSVSGTFASNTAPTGFALSPIYGPSSVTIGEAAVPHTAMSITPESGGDLGGVTVQIVLSAPVASGTTVKLSRSGYADITGSSVVLGPGGRSLTAVFDLRNEADGTWDVVVTNVVDGTSYTLPGGFTIVSGKASTLFTYILGRYNARVGTPTEVSVFYGNSGFDDVYGAVLFIHIPYGVDIESVEGLVEPDAGSLPPGLDPYVVDTGSEHMVAVWIYDVSALSSTPVRLTLMSPTEQNVPISAELWQPPSSSFSQTGDWSTPPDFIGQLAVAMAIEVVATEQASSAVHSTSAAIRANTDTLDTSACRKEFSDPDAQLGCTEDAQTFYSEIHKWWLSHISPGPSARAYSCEILVEGGGPLGQLTGAACIIWHVLDIAVFGAKDARDTINQHYAAAHDPNEMVGRAGSGSQHYVSDDSPLQYAAFFENVPTASLPAQKVTITDQLDVTKVDLSTFALGTISIGSNVVTPLLGQSAFVQDVDLRPATDLIVRVNAQLDQSTGLVTWTFTSLDPATGLPPADPTVGFLPPGAEGSVFFSVMPRQGLATGSVISNAARVTFDANAPIDTDAWQNTIDNTKPTSSVSPLAPTQTSNSFPVQWSGSDVGAGIQDFTIFDSDNGGPFTIWQANTTATSATFTGQSGHTYGFYSVARDLVGNQEDTPTSAQATTQVELMHTTALSYTGATSGDYDDAVTLAATLTDSSASPAAGVSGVPITFSLGTQSCTGTTNTTGKATCSVTLIQTPGSVNVSASFAGNSTYTPSDTTPTQFTIGTEETALTITSSPSLTYGSVVVKAVLTEDGQTPLAGRTVSFGASGVTGTGTTDATGTASATLALGAGQYTLTASFAGDTTYAASSTSNNLTVNPAGTTTTLTSSANPSLLNQPVSFTAAVASAAGTPGGTVQFTIDGSNFGSPITLAGGKATSGSISTLAVGSHTIEAIYSGATNYSGSTGTLTQKVTYQIKALYDQTASKSGGTSVPIKVQLLDYSGKNVSSSRVILTLSTPALSPSPSPGAQPSGTFTFMATGDAGPMYQYNVKTTGYPAHTYTLSFTASGDPVAHTVQFVIG